MSEDSEPSELRLTGEQRVRLASLQTLHALGSDDDACVAWLSKNWQHASLLCVDGPLSAGCDNFVLQLLRLLSESDDFDPLEPLDNDIALMCDLAENRCWKGSKGFQFLVDKYPKAVNVLDMFGRTPLFIACAGAQPPNIRTLMRCKSTSICTMMHTRFGRKRWTPLHVLAKLPPDDSDRCFQALCDPQSEKYSDMMDEMLDRLDDVNADGETPLGLALRHHDDVSAASRWLCRLAVLAPCSSEDEHPHCRVCMSGTALANDSCVQCVRFVAEDAVRSLARAVTESSPTHSVAKSRIDTETLVRHAFIDAGVAAEFVVRELLLLDGEPTA